MFSRREYEYVMEIAKEGSFSKAAQKLYVSQPALSGAIKKLEKDLYGIPLFDRAVTPVALTPAGQYYLEQARKIYELRNEIEHHFADLAGIRTGIINIGTSGYFCAYLLPDIIRGEMQDQCDGDGCLRHGRRSPFRTVQYHDRCRGAGSGNV